MPAVASLKVCTLMSKAYKVLGKKVQKIMSHGTEEWWRANSCAIRFFCAMR